MSDNKEINIRIKKKHLTIAIVTVTAASMIIPYQIFAQNQTSPQPPEASEPLNSPQIESPASSPLTNVNAIPSNNLILGQSYYIIAFTIASEGTIKTVEISFPSGFNLANAKVIEVSAIGTGTLAVSGQMLRYIVTSEASIPAGTRISIMLGDIINGKSINNQIIVATKSANAVIDGPTLSSIFNLTRISGDVIRNSSITTKEIKDGNVMTDDIADNSVTTPKIADDAVTVDKITPTFMKFNQLNDDKLGKAAGWKPDGKRTDFVIVDADLKADSVVAVTVDDLGLPGIKVRYHAYDTAVNPPTNKVYVAIFDGTVSVIDASTNFVIDNIYGVPSPIAMAANPNTNRVYVSSWSQKQISVIDGSTDTLLDIIDVPHGQYGIAVDPNTNRVYATSEYLTEPPKTTVLVIDGSTNRLITTIDVGDDPPRASDIPLGIAINPSTNKVYVTKNSGEVSVIDEITATVVNTISVGPCCNIGIAINPNTNKLYIANQRLDRIFVVDALTDTVKSSIDVGAIPEELREVVVDPIRNKVYVTNTNSHNVVVIDGVRDKVIGNISVDGTPVGADINPEMGKLYVAHLGPDTVSVINTSTDSLEPVVTPTPMSCSIFALIDEFIKIHCTAAPSEGAILNYSITSP